MNEKERRKKGKNTFLVPVSIIETVISKISFSSLLVSKHRATSQFHKPSNNKSYPPFSNNRANAHHNIQHRVNFQTSSNAAIHTPTNLPLRPLRNFAQTTNRSITVSSNNSLGGAVDTSANSLKPSRTHRRAWKEEINGENTLAVVI